MQYSAATAQHRLSLISTCVLGAISLLSACGGGGGSGSEPEKPLSAEVPSMSSTILSAASAATAGEAAASAASAPESSTAQAAAAVSADPVAAAAAASAAASAAAEATSKIAGARLKTDTVAAKLPAPKPAVLPSTATTPAPSPAVATNTAAIPKLTPVPAPVQVLPQLVLPTPTPTPAPPAIGQVTPLTKTAPTAQVSIWDEVEALRSTLVASATERSLSSSAQALQAPTYGIFYGQRTAKENWEGLIAKAKTSADLKNWIAGQRAEVDGWISAPHERADLVGGWIHNYVDPATGLPMEWKPSTPEPAPAPGTGEQKVREAWVAYMRGHNISRMQIAARLFRATGEEKYAIWAAKQLDFYAENYKSWPLRTYNGRGQMYRHGLDEATDSFTLTDTARLLENYAGSVRNQKWRDGLFRPMASNLEFVTSPKTNIALWHFGAIAGIAMRYKDTALLEKAQNSPEGIIPTLNYGATADNLWIEGTFSYNTHVLEALSKLLTQASLEGYQERFSTERAVALRLLLAPFDYRFENNSLPNPSDSASVQNVVTPSIHWKLYRVLPTYYGTKLANEWQTWESLLDPPTSTPAVTPALPPVESRNFSAIRMAVLRSQPWQVFVHYGQITGNHAQEEALTYEVHHGSKPISTDSGAAGYATSYQNDYFSRGPANNVVLIDGAGQSSWAKGDIDSFLPTENRLIAQHSSYRPGVQVIRGYRVTANGFTERTRITVQGITPSQAPVAKRLGSAFHTSCTVTPANGLTEASLQALPNALGISFWKNPTMWTATPGWAVNLNCNGSNYTMSVKSKTAQRVYLSQAPTTPLPASRSVIYYETTGINAEYDVEIRAKQ